MWQHAVRRVLELHDIPVAEFRHYQCAPSGWRFAVIVTKPAPERHYYVDTVDDLAVPVANQFHQPPTAKELAK